MSGRIMRLSAMLQSGEISSRELTQSYISRIERLNPMVNAVVHTTFDEALKNADYADRLIKEGRATLLTGIPMLLKDNICTDGLPTTCCSKILQGFKPYYDATVWKKLRARARCCSARPIWTNSLWALLPKPRYTAHPETPSI